MSGLLIKPGDHSALSEHEDWSEEYKNAIPVKWDPIKGWVDNPESKVDSATAVNKLRDEWADREHDIYVKMQPLKTRDAIGILKKEEK